jgi:ferredoxin
MAICGVCVLEVQTGAENLSLMEDREADTIEDLSAKQPASSGRIRLACQVKVLGDAVVVKPGVKRKDELGSPPPIYFA